MKRKQSGIEGPLQGFASCSLAPQQKGLGEFAFAANLEGAEVFVPFTVGRVRLGLTPQFELVEILGRDLALFEAVKKVLSQGPWKIGPLDFRHYSPNVICANSFLIRCRSARSLDSDRRFASAKNRSFSDSFDSRPASIRSTITRLALALRVSAIRRTRLAMGTGSDTLCRTFFPFFGISLFYTTLHHSALPQAGVPGSARS